MKRMAKPEGRGNVMLEDAPMPEPGYGEVRVKSVRSLISRGSEIGRRYVMEEAIDPQMMGYSMAGVVDALGEGVEHLAIGDRVGAVAPHAQYVLGAALPEQQGKIPEIFPLTPGVSWDQAPYWMLGAHRPFAGSTSRRSSATTSSSSWVRAWSAASCSRPCAR